MKREKGKMKRKADEEGKRKSACCVCGAEKSGWKKSYGGAQGNRVRWEVDMALTRDGMESKTRHGELANGHDQLVGYEGTAKCALECVQGGRLEENPQSLALNKRIKKMIACLAT